MKYLFEWDPDKAFSNLKKHKVAFELASSIFHDPNMISVFDGEHSNDEDRWATIGLDSNGNLLIVIHTFKSVGRGRNMIRIISARKATRNETKQYREVNR